MLKFKAAYSSKDGKLLDMKTALCGGVTAQAAVEAIGDAVARIVHNVVAVHGDSVDPGELIASILGQAYTTYPTLPEITEEMHEVVKKANDEPDPEPEYRGEPSSDDDQVMTCGLALRVNGYEVYHGGANTQPVPFDELTEVMAGMIGTVVAYGLTGMMTPVSITGREEYALEAFKTAWAVNLPLGKAQREAAATETTRRRITKFIEGKLQEGN